MGKLRARLVICVSVRMCVCGAGLAGEILEGKIFCRYLPSKDLYILNLNQILKVTKSIQMSTFT